MNWQVRSGKADITRLRAGSGRRTSQLNHCPVTRQELRASGLPVLVPDDGETIST